MADFLTIPHEKSTLVIEPPGPLAPFADRDHFLWTDELVQTYLRTRRVLWQGEIWERSGVCNQCGACCRWDERVPFGLWASSYTTMEREWKENRWPLYISQLQPDREGLFWCRYLHHPAGGWWMRHDEWRWPKTGGVAGLPTCDYYCTIWSRQGFSGLPAICQVEPCTPRHDQEPTWFERHPLCSLHFEDVTQVYIPAGDP